VSTQKKVWLGIASVAPLVLQAAYSVVLFVTLAATDFNEDEPTWLWIAMFVVIALSVLGAWAMLAYYIVLLFRVEPADDSKRTLWIVLLLMLQGLALPVFWFLFIWREESLAPKVPPWVYWQPPPGQWQQPPPGWQQQPPGWQQPPSYQGPPPGPERPGG
jgi:hypothetical protein